MNIKFGLGAVVIAAMLSSCGEDPVIPTAEFSYEPAEIIQYDEVAFMNTSTDADSYAWDFGDGGSSTDMDPTYMFSNSGTFTIKLVASNADGENETEQNIVVSEAVNEYTIADTTYSVDSDMFWYQSSMGGDPYLRLLTSVAGQENPDLLKIYPNMGLNELPGTYPWEAKPSMGSATAGTYDIGYTAGYAGLNFDWAATAKDGSGDLEITELEAGVYRVEAVAIFSIGYYDFANGGVFVETGTASLTLNYVGAITPLS